MGSASASAQPALHGRAREIVDQIADLAPEERALLLAHLATAYPPAPRRIDGWKTIAAELGVSERTAREHGARDRDPLPWEGPAGVGACAAPHPAGAG